MKAAALLLVLAACAGRPGPEPEPAPPSTTACPAPLTISTHDQVTPATLREMRRVNRDLRRLCAG